jgi:Na+/melibiose symporter-like transporter
MVIFVLGAVLGWYGFPALVRSQITSVSKNILLLVIYVNPHFPTIFLTGANHSGRVI